MSVRATWQLLFERSIFVEFVAKLYILLLSCSAVGSDEVEYFVHAYCENFSSLVPFKVVLQCPYSATMQQIFQ